MSKRADLLERLAELWRLQDGLPADKRQEFKLLEKFESMRIALRDAGWQVIPATFRAPTYKEMSISDQGLERGFVPALGPSAEAPLALPASQTIPSSTGTGSSGASG